MNSDWGVSEGWEEAYGLPMEKATACHRHTTPHLPLRLDGVGTVANEIDFRLPARQKTGLIYCLKRMFAFKQAYQHFLPVECLGSKPKRGEVEGRAM